MKEYFSENWPMLVLGIVMILGIIATLVVQGSASHKKLSRLVSRALRRYAAPRRFRVLDHVAFETPKGTATVDHVMIGYFGLLFVNDLYLDGDFYGELTDPTWICNRTDKNSEITDRVGTEANPLMAAQVCVEAAREKLGRQGLYNLPMESFAVKAYRKGDFLVTGAKDRLYNLKTLSSGLHRTWFDKDTGLDVEKVAAALLA